MNTKEHSERLKKFIKNLEKQDLKLYYEFLNLYDFYIENVEKELTELKEDNQRYQLYLQKIDLKNRKQSYDIHDNSINFTNELHELKNKINSDAMKLEKEAIQLVLEYSKKEFEYLDRITKFVYNKPRFAGLMLLIMGNKQIKFINNLDLSKYKNNTTEQQESD